MERANGVKLTQYEFINDNFTEEILNQKFYFHILNFTNAFANSLLRLA